jgi:hypothetical protein
MDPAKVPAHIRALFAPEKNSGLVTTGDSFPQISIKGFRFRLRVPDQEEQVLERGTELPVVILGYDPIKGTAKTYYEGAYEEDSNDPPDCSSSDGITPDEWMASPCAAKCSACEHNAWGSGKNGRGKACSDQKRLVVASPRQLGTDEEVILFVLRVPPASLKGLSGYAREMNQYNVPVSYVKTVLGFVDDPEIDYPQLEFTFGGFLEEDEAKRAAELMERDVPELLSLIHRSSVARADTGTPPPADDEKEEPPAETAAEKKKRVAAAKKAAKAEEKKAAAAAEEPVAEEPVAEEPVAEEPVAGGKLDDILNKW